MNEENFPRTTISIQRANLKQVLHFKTYSSFITDVIMYKAGQTSWTIRGSDDQRGGLSAAFSPQTTQEILDNFPYVSACDHGAGHYWRPGYTHIQQREYRAKLCKMGFY